MRRAKAAKKIPAISSRCKDTALQKLVFEDPNSVCPETGAVFDREDGRFRSQKQTFSETRRKVGLETWGSDSSPDPSKGPSAPVQEKGT